MKAEEILAAARRCKQSAEAKTEHQDILKVSLEDEWYGINIVDVVEVKICPKIFRIPHTPDYVIGVVNLRGEILSVIDIRKLLGLSTTLSDDQKHIVVVERDSVKVGIRVDRAADVVSIPNSDVKSSLSTADGSKGFTAGEIQLDGAVLAILNLDALIEIEGKH
jgi:purine-binding chemotaxis protein CheW